MDAAIWKRRLIVPSVLAVGLGCLPIVWFPGSWPAVMTQALLGPTGFLGLAGLALCALVFFLILMPETGRDAIGPQTTAAS